MTNQAIRTELIRIIRGAGALALEIRRRPTSINVLEWKEFVTEADKEVDRFIGAALAQSFPSIPIYSEEDEDRPSLDTGECFAVDPIDGTHHYARRVGEWGISIAYLVDGSTKVSVVYDPENDRVYYADADTDGAWCLISDSSLPTRLSVTRNDTPADFGRQCWVKTDWVKGDNDETVRILAALKELTTYPEIAMCSTRTLMHVATGTLHGYIHLRPGPEDSAAAAYIVQKAGGYVTHRNGEPWRAGADDTSLVAGVSEAINSGLRGVLSRQQK